MAPDGPVNAVPPMNALPAALAPGSEHSGSRERSRALPRSGRTPGASTSR